MMNDNTHLTPRPMNDSGRDAGWRRRTWPSTGRTVGAVIAAAGLALLAAACGGSPGSHVAQLGSTTTQTNTSSNAPTTSTQQNGTLAFANCMRSHGVPNFPDPDSNGALVKQTPQQLGVSSSQFDTALTACGQLLPTPTQSPAQLQHQRAAELLRLARCMRAHGIHNFPDPTSTGEITKPPGLDLNSPQVQAAHKACQHYAPVHGSPGPPGP
jgi:hypothetical protein